MTWCAEGGVKGCGEIDGGFPAHLDGGVAGWGGEDGGVNAYEESSRGGRGGGVVGGEGEKEDRVIFWAAS